MKISFYYTRDADGAKYVAFKESGNDSPPLKNSERKAWESPEDTSYNWVNFKYASSYHILSILKEALDNIPEPSWEDEFPMLVTIDVQCTNINYSYVE